MLLATALLIGLLSLIIYSKTTSKKYRLPPGPKGNFFFGSLIELMISTWKGTAPFSKFADWAFEYGPLCYLEFGTQKVLVVADAKIAQQLCVGQSDKFSERPPTLFISRVLKGKGIVFNEGASWKEHRSFISQEFRKFGFGHHSVEQRIQHVLDEFLLHVEKTQGVAHNPHLNFATATYNIIWQVISGDTFKWDDPFLRKLISNLETNLVAMELVGAHNYVSLLTLLHLLYHNPYNLISIVTKRFSYFSQLINNRKNEMEKEQSEQESLIQDYLIKLKNSADNKELSYFSEEQLLNLVSDLFIAGGETTITTLRWMLFCLALYPDIQEKVRKELFEVIGSESLPSYAQRSQLPYLDAFIHETFRFCGVTPGMWRNTSEDAVYQGYDIPKGTWVLLHFWAMHNNTTQWENADQFLPERFLNENGMFQKNDNLIAFSTGKRQCPGEALARTEIFMFITGILQKFQISFPPGTQADVKSGIFGITYTPPHFEVIFNKIQT